jgi:transposase InsO family protein
MPSKARSKDALAWRTEYDNYRPHSSLSDLTPAEFSEKWTLNQPALP